MEKTLYEINEEYLGILAQIEDNEGELTPELEQALAINEENHAAKLEAYGNRQEGRRSSPPCGMLAR